MVHPGNNQDVVWQGWARLVHNRCGIGASQGRLPAPIGRSTALRSMDHAAPLPTRACQGTLFVGAPRYPAGVMQSLPPQPWIHRVQIENFRRFATADWHLRPGVNCLIGPGDSGKSTLMTAIEYALWPSYALSITDNDFHRGNLEAEIVIRVWVVNPPLILRTDNKHFAHLQGFDGTRVLPDPSEEEDDPTVLQIELRVAGDLEPAWSVVKPPLQSRPIRAADRSSLGMSRIGEDLEKHLRWTRGSALMRLTTDAANAQDIVRSASRSARSGTSGRLREALAGITSPIDEVAHRLRALPTGTTLVADSDLDSTTRGLGQVTLHTDQDVPITRSGQGTQRLVAVSAQLSSVRQPGILLCDELEHGLEPHRVQHLLGAMKQHVAKGTLTQVVLTTHSPRAIRELSADQLQRVLIGADGVPEVRPFTPAWQGTIRAAAEALLSPRVIVCEGATEVGLVRGLVSALQKQEPAQYASVEPTDAHSSSALVRYANQLNGMGYEVAAFYDLDKEPKDLDKLKPAVARFAQERGHAAEHQIFTDLSTAGVREAVDLAKSLLGFDDAQLAQKLVSRGCSSSDVATLQVGGPAIPRVVRRQLAQTAIADGWFKRVDKGEDLVQACLPHLDGTYLGRMFARMQAWMMRP